jgi:hypothetical protein
MLIDEETIRTENMIMITKCFVNTTGPMEKNISGNEGIKNFLTQKTVISEGIANCIKDSKLMSPLLIKAYAPIREVNPTTKREYPVATSAG